jgi:hypothetical protein
VTRSIQCLGIVASIIATPLGASAPAMAQNSVSYVSNSGDDNNACNSTAFPCLTMNGAVGKTNAGGLVICLDPMTTTSIFIDKPVKIDCTAMPAVILGFRFQTAITININRVTHPNAVVTLRSLILEGALFHGADGIRWIGDGGVLHVEDVRIIGFAGQGIEFAPTSNGHLFVKDAIVTNNAGGGILIAPQGSTAVRAALSNVRLNQNKSYGVLVSKSGPGQANVTLNDVEVDRNPSVGVHASGNKAVIRLNNSTVTLNGLGLRPASGGKIISFGNNAILANTTDGDPTSTVALR